MFPADGLHTARQVLILLAFCYLCYLLLLLISGRSFNTGVAELGDRPSVNHSQLDPLCYRGKYVLAHFAGRAKKTKSPDQMGGWT